MAVVAAAVAAAAAAAAAAVAAECSNNTNTTTQQNTTMQTKHPACQLMPDRSTTCYDVTTIVCNTLRLLRLLLHIWSE